MSCVYCSHCQAALLPSPATAISRLITAAEAMLAAGDPPAVGYVGLDDFRELTESRHFRWGGRASNDPDDRPGLLVDGIGGKFEGRYVLVRCHRADVVDGVEQPTGDAVELLP